MCFLPLRRDMRDWQEQTGEQIVADAFDEHPQAQGAYRFDLRQAMPQYSNRVQSSRRLARTPLSGKRATPPALHQHDVVLFS